MAWLVLVLLIMGLLPATPLGARGFGSPLDLGIASRHGRRAASRLRSTRRAFCARSSQ
jgi:hypothetical protein